MKTFTILLLFCFSIAFGQTEEYVLEKTSNKVTTFVMENASYKFYYLDSTVTFKDKTYYVRLREYSWGDIDTGFIRKDADYFYSGNYDGEEVIMLPRKPVVGQKWYPADSSWVFEVKSINAQLSTPVKKYVNLVEVIAKNKLYSKGDRTEKEYHNFYLKGVGFVGNVVYGKLFSYLKTIETK